MAAIIREGGSSPMLVQSWQDAVKLQILNKIYDCSGNRLYRDIFKWFDEELEYISKRWGHKLVESEAKQILIKMIADGWVEVSEFTCACCAKQKHEPQEILNHAVRLRLTKLGYTKVPEYIFP